MAKTLSRISHLLTLRGFPELDSLRFFAVTLVIGHHLFFTSNPIFEWFSIHGYVGVDIFFVLSGFIITNNLIKNNFQYKDIKAFIIKRALRLWPSWLLTILVSSLIIIYFSRNNPSLQTSLYSKWWHYLLHFGNYSHAYFGKVHTLYSHFWSLAVEEHFYLLWPFLFLLTFNKKRKYILYLLIIIPYILRVMHQINGLENITITFSTHTRFDSLASGCILAYFLNKLPTLRNYILDITLWIISFFIMWIGLELKFYEGSAWLHQLSFSVRNLASCAFIYLLIKGHSKGLRYILSNQFFARLGLLSYGAYLYHFIINTFLFRYFPQIDYYQILIFILANTLVYIPSLLTYVFIDVKIHQQRQWFLDKFSA